MREVLEDQFRDVYEETFGVRPVFDLSYLSDVELNSRIANTVVSFIHGPWNLDS